MRIDHINIRAPGPLIEKVKEFYCDLFGMEAGARPTFRQGGYWLYTGGKALIHLSISKDDPGGGPPGYLDHVAFQSSGLEGFTAKLNALDIEYRSNHIPELDMTQLFFTDPAGTGIEVNFPGE